MKPDLTGTRIVLRTIGPQDAADLFEIYGNPLTMEFASEACFTSPAMVVQMMASVVQLEQTDESLEWAIVERESNKVIGTCGLHSFSEAGHCCEVGCLLNAAYWRRGFMSEALGLLFAHASTLGVTRLTADIDADNVRSIAPCLKAGLQGACGALSAHDPVCLTRGQRHNPLASQAVVARISHKKTGTQGFRFFSFQPRLVNQQIKPGF
jgi:ribosomal-protein-alanine N-acetyltransferase